MQLRIKLAALAMAGGTAALVLTAAPALASSHATSNAVTGPEVAYGAVYGKAATANNPVIPVVWRGLVIAHGVFSPNGPPPIKGQHHTFVTSAGNPAAEAAASTTASRSAARRTEFAFTVKLFTPRRMVPRLVSRPGWTSPAYSISSGALRVQKRAGSDLR